MSRLSYRIRPKDLTEVYGHSSAVRHLQRVSNNPDDSYQVYLLSGEYGLGKTSMARAFHGSLVKKFGDDVVDFRLINSPEVQDPTNVRQLTQFLREDWPGYRVIVFDEFHWVTPVQQASLLPALDNLDPKTFVFFLGNEIKSIIDPLRDRCFEFPLSLFNVEDIIKYLDGILIRENLKVGDRTLGLIAEASSGHLRSAVNLLERVLNSPEEETEFIDESDKVTKALEALMVTGDKASVDFLAQMPYHILSSRLEYYILHDVVMAGKHFRPQDLPRVFSFWVKGKRGISSMSDLHAFLHIFAGNIRAIRAGHVV